MSEHQNHALYVDPAVLRSVPMRALAIGAGLLIVCAIGGWFNPADFLRSYLIAFLFWLAVTLGCMAILMVQHLTGGRWALVIRRILEAASRALPLMAVAVVPILLGMKTIYSWTHLVDTDAVVMQKRFYLNPGFFVGRAVFYFAAWFLLMYVLNKWSRTEDAEGGLQSGLRLEAWSAGGLVLYGLTVTFASIDWLMSLEPRWYSSIFGLLFMVGQALTGLAFAVIVLIWISRREPLSEVVTADQYQDLGSFLLTFVMLWAYMEFSQFLIIWGGDLSDEIPWYLRRTHGMWGYIGLSLVLLDFAIPFFLLLFRYIKRQPRNLLKVAALLLVMRLLDAYWMVLPGTAGEHAGITWLNLLLPVAFGFIWFSYFAWQLQRMPILPVNDPRLKELTEHAIEH